MTPYARRPTTAGRRAPFRKTVVVVEGLTALAGVMGTVQLLTETFTPPVSVLEPIGLSSWMLPGLWLFGTVVVPSATAAVLAWRASPYALPVDAAGQCDPGGRTARADSLPRPEPFAGGHGNRCRRDGGRRLPSPSVRLVADGGSGA